MKPKLYQLPLLFTAYMAVSSLNRLIINVKGEINPCNSPYQKPNGSPDMHSSTGVTGAQPEMVKSRIMPVTGSRKKGFFSIIKLVLSNV